LHLFRFQQDEYERSVFVSSSGDSLNYRLLEPEVMQAGEKYPLVLFLHGAGERGNDNEKQLTHGGQMFLNPVNREKYPAFVLFPQCPESGYWAYENRPQSFIPTQMPVGKEMPSVFQAVKELLDMYLANPQVDKSRVYIMGLSMGAMGTYDMVSRFPDIFDDTLDVNVQVERYPISWRIMA
jgi:predicted peptidase